MSSGMWGRILWYTVSNVLEGRAAPIPPYSEYKNYSDFEDGNSTFLRNTDTDLPDFTASRPSFRQCLQSQLWKP
jgi:hypothetical protein